ncbi:peptide ABC transporter substrate-binding protein [Robertmurraya yapensis]|uniref:Peptide ABC transporter substrate-binding protein n=2 Tax=Bacillaceae TaxID=186817 RepID=A0A431W3D3_9BACI|nr:peptide ABC transporter substrate-binding protein [Bacillus yapensis]RTR29938.1 peptide ABC transporter substrate-binding protein [Bacillus yapensis]TKS95019.1 peptide ABC transporter substrate-binding protein [Bacillus yapensis]
MRKYLSIFLATLLIFVLAACTANEDAGEDPKDEDGATEEASEKVLYWNNSIEPTSFDPPVGFDAVSWSGLNNLMEGLTRLDESHTPQPAIAEDWDVSEDGKTYTFHIRENAKWSNGDDLKASDFVFAWKRALDPELAASSAFLGYLIEGAEAYNSGTGSADAVAVKAVDDKTFEVTLTSPQAYFLNIISLPTFFPINEKVATENPEWFAEAESFVGNGPFNLTEWEHDSHFVMEKNDQYWDAENVKIDKIHWAMVDDPNTEYQMYQAGELDSSNIPPELSEQLFEEGDVEIVDQAGLYFYRFNVTKEPFQNKNIRKAFALAVDQQQIVDYVTKGKEEPAYGFVSPGFPDANGQDFRETSGDLLKTNVEEAKELLKKGMEEEGYETLPEVTLTYSSTETHKVMAEAIQPMFKEVLGVDVKLQSVESSVFSEEQTELKYQLSRSSFLNDFADPINSLESFQTGHSMNRTGWSNAEYDKLIQDAKKESDEAKRFEMLYQAEKILMDEAPIFTVHFYNQTFLQNEAVTGVVRHPVGYVEFKWADKAE